MLRSDWGKVRRNYDRVFESVPFWRYIGNSLFVVALATIGTLLSSSFVAYAFARGLPLASCGVAREVNSSESGEEVHDAEADLRESERRQHLPRAVLRHARVTVRTRAR